MNNQIAEILKQDQEEIIQCWIKCVQKNVPDAKDESKIIIRDHIAIFLDNLVENLKQPDRKVGSEHGMHKLKKTNYSLHGLIQEYHFLRTVIFDYLDDKVKMDKLSRDIINELIDSSVCEATLHLEGGDKKNQTRIKRQEAILDSATDLLWLMDRNFRFLYANQSLLTLWGKKEEQIIGKTCLELDYPLEVAQQIESETAEAFKGEKVFSETRYTNYEGKDGWYQYIMSPIFDEAGQISSVAGIARDITKTKYLEKKLETHVRELEDFFNQSPVPMAIVMGDEYYFSLANPPYEKMIGRKAQNLKISEVFSEDEVKNYIPLLEGVRETGKAYIGKEVLFKLKQNDGSFLEKYLDFGYHPFLDFDGSVKGVLAIAIDTTQEVLAKNELHKVIDQLRIKNEEILNVLESMNDGFFVMDKNFIITRVNRRHVDMTKVPAEEQIGKNIFKLFPDTAKKDSQYWQNYTFAMSERKAVNFTEYYAPLDLWTDVNIYPKEDGGLAVFFRDISEQKRDQEKAQAEKLKFEALFFDSPAALALLHGPTFIFEKVNPLYQDFFRGRELVGKALIEALPELVDTQFPQIMHDVYETGIPYKGIEMLVPLVRVAGGPLVDSYFDFTYDRIEDGKGNSYGTFIHAIDVTDRVKSRMTMEEKSVQLEKSEERLILAVNARDEFLSVASHELKTPITSLKLQLQSAKRRFNKGVGSMSSDEMNSLFDRSVLQVDRLVRLVDDMLDLSRVQSGKLSYHFRPMDLHELVMELFNRFRDTIEEKTKSFTVDSEPNIVGNFDSERLEQVIINLLTNALKYGQGSPVHMKLTKKDHYAFISVQDQGLGIRSENFERIFQRFERVVTANEVSGLGIGLYVSKQIVEAHGGRIWVESQIGKGSTFCVSLPLRN